MSREEPKKCESELSCKASASLNESVKADLQSEDKPLQELLNEKDKSDTANTDTGEASN